LIVGYFHWLAATEGHGPIHLSIFSCLVVWHPKQGNRLRRRQTCWRASCMDPWGDAAPWVGSTSGLLMEGESKAAERQGGGGPCWLLLWIFVLLCVTFLARLTKPTL
jgi:hypothetical protein